MKTKELSVYVKESVTESANFIVFKDHDGRAWDGFLKGRLILEYPERRVQISESEYDEAWKKWKGQGSCDFFREQIREKLFGKGEA